MGWAGQHLCHALLCEQQLLQGIPLLLSCLTQGGKIFEQVGKIWLNWKQGFFESITFCLKPKQSLPVQQKFGFKLFFLSQLWLHLKAKQGCRSSSKWGCRIMLLELLFKEASFVAAISVPFHQKKRISWLFQGTVFCVITSKFTS